MSPRLRHDAVARVDENDREIRRRGAGRHVARVLLVTGRVCDDEFAFRGREITVRDVDRDALLAFRLESVSQQRGIEITAGRAVDFRVLLQRCELVLVDHLRVVQEATDERALAVVDAAARDEAQQLLALVLLQILLDIARNELGLM